MTNSGESTHAEPLRLGDRLRAEFQRVMATYRFEMRRTVSSSRLTAWGILVVFPAAIMGLIRNNSGSLDSATWGVLMYLLVAQATPLLGLLLWVAPVVQVELEGRTWQYIAVRPGGKLAVLLGKYLNGVSWTLAAGLTGLTASILIGRPDVESRWKLFIVLASLQAIGCFSYGALYLALGTLFPRRSMVFAVGYTLVLEVVISLVPATINQITVQHRLWNLLWHWMAWVPTPEVDLTLTDQSPGMHLFILLVYTCVLLTISAVAIRAREYLTTPEV